MKFYFYDRIRNGSPREMKMDEVREHLSPAQIDDAIEAMMAILQPLIMVFMGGMVGFLLIGMYLPIFSMGDIAGG